MYYKTVLHVATVFQLLFGDWCPRLQNCKYKYLLFLVIHEQQMGGKKTHTEIYNELMSLIASQIVRLKEEEIEYRTDFTSCERKSTLEKEKNNGFKLNNEWNSSLFIYCIYCDTRNTILWLSINVCHLLWFRLHDTHDHQEVFCFFLS